MKEKIFSFVKVKVSVQGRIQNLAQGGKLLAREARRKFLPPLECFLPRLEGGQKALQGGQSFLWHFARELELES